MQAESERPYPGLTLDDQARARIARAADVLIPGDDAMPSASAADVAGSALDAVLTARPDLAAVVLELATCAQPPRQRLDALYAEDREAFEGFVLVIACAYGMDERVRLSLRYPGQIAHPIDEDQAELDQLLATVSARGQIYVPTRGSAS